MFKVILALAGTLFLFSTSAGLAETFNEQFCQKEHPNDYKACLQYEEREDHKLFTRDAGHASSSSETIPYSPADEARKLRLRQPVPGEIIMDSSPAKEIPMK